MHNLVPRVESVASPKHRVVSDMLAIQADSRNRANVDLPRIWIAEWRTDAIVGEQD
jgi:hypothetical protein